MGPQDGMAEMRRTVQQRRDQLSVVFQSVDSLSSAVWRPDPRARPPRQESRQIQPHRRRLRQHHGSTVITFQMAEPLSAGLLAHFHLPALPIED